MHRIITEAVDRGVSDIHFEPQDGDMRVRYRIDGVLRDAAIIPENSVPAVASRVKILSDLDIAERRVPQDGRISLELDEKHIDLRVATLPSAFGENIVMRILDSSKALIAMETLGMLPQALERFTKAIGQSHGAVLVTGPTGSGKSTSLYAALNVLNTVEKNIITIEDPVEYQLEGITQVQTNPRAGLTFSSGLRSMMRADPDIIMVGEIRDRETAQIAIEAALTGHLVLSTLHTNDAPGAISRLIEMGIEPFLVGSAVDCVVAQRLARLLCEECKRRTTHHRRRHARQRLQRRPRPRGLRARRLRPLRRLGLQGPRSASTRSCGCPRRSARSRSPASPPRTSRTPPCTRA